MGMYNILEFKPYIHSTQMEDEPKFITTGNTGNTGSTGENIKKAISVFSAILGIIILE